MSRHITITKDEYDSLQEVYDAGRHVIDMRENGRTGDLEKSLTSLKETIELHEKDHGDF